MDVPGSDEMGFYLGAVLLGVGTAFFLLTNFRKQNA